MVRVTLQWRHEPTLPWVKHDLDAWQDAADFLEAWINEDKPVIAKYFPARRCA